MGMDVYGKNPVGEVGKYFRNNCWWWRPLWVYCEQVAPEITSSVQYGQSNDGDGLKTQEDCNRLADKLEAAIDSGVQLKRSEDYLQKLDQGEPMYPFDFENVREFIAFLRECGGFEIN